MVRWRTMRTANFSQLGGRYPFVRFQLLIMPKKRSFFRNNATSKISAQIEPPLNDEVLSCFGIG